MYQFMRIKILLICIVLLFIAFNIAVAKNDNFSNSNVSSSENVIKNIKNSDNLYIEKIGTYSLEKDGCAIFWEVSVHRDKKEKNIILRTRQPMGVTCTFPFVKQLPLHRKIFNEIFKDWGKQQFHSLFIGPLYRLEPGNTWNIRMAMASSDSSDWADWCKNYPHHSSGKSSNRIFVELANQVDAYRELASLFKEFGLQIELHSVEKVFGKKAKELPFYKELKSRGLEGNPRLIYDAGMIYFSISLLN